MDLPGFQMALVVKNMPANAGDMRDRSSMPGLGRTPGWGHDNPSQYFCLENPMDRGPWQAIVHRITQSQTRLKWLSTHALACLSNFNQFTRKLRWWQWLEIVSGRKFKIYAGTSFMSVFITALHPQHLSCCHVHGICSINICGMNKWRTSWVRSSAIKLLIL